MKFGCLLGLGCKMGWGSVFNKAAIRVFAIRFCAIRVFAVRDCAIRDFGGVMWSPFACFNITRFVPIRLLPIASYSLNQFVVILGWVLVN